MSVVAFIDRSWVQAGVGLKKGLSPTVVEVNDIADENTGIGLADEDHILTAIGPLALTFALNAIDDNPHLEIRLIVVLPATQHDLLKRLDPKYFDYLDIIRVKPTDDSATINNCINNAIIYAQNWMAG